jgi:hypothetical protein
MPVQSLIWTVLPNGVTADGTGLRFSVLVSPRLEPQSAPARLSSFADFVDWPSTLAASTVTLNLGTVSLPLTAAHVDGTIGVPDSKVWAALLPATTRVESFVMKEHADTKVLSFDAVAMHTVLQQLYATMTVAAGVDLPAITELQTVLKPVIDGVRAVDGLKQDTRSPGRDVDGERDTWASSGFKGLPGLGAQLATFQLFHTPASRQTSQTYTPADERNAVTWRTHERATIDAEAFVASLDFHRIVSAMNQYAPLLRRLGLVLDYVVPRGTVANAPNLPVSVTVKLPTAPTLPAAQRVSRRDAAPRTRTQLSANVFTPVPRAESSGAALRVSNRLLVMEPERLAVVQVDVDGSGLKLMNFARSLIGHDAVARQVDPITKLPRRAGAPALRGGGVMLVHRGRGESLTTAFRRNTALNTAMERLFARRAGAVAELFAEDLVRGWRLDVWDKSTGLWRSLCERLAAYSLTAGELALTGVREEGTVRLAATTAADGSNPDVMSLHEVMAVWRGWSLAAPSPGLVLGTDDTVADPSPVVPSGIPLRTSFVAAPGSLPRLRYGRVYAMRARVVDLAGNSLPPSTANYKGDEAARNAATPYWRYEPVPSPLIALVGTAQDVEAPGPGESMTHLAIRTLNDDFDSPTPSTEVARRWAMTPRVSQREAELHGVCDGPEWGKAPQYAMLAARDTEPPVVSLPTRNGGSISYTAMPAETVTLPYLPDPLATQVSARLSNYRWNGPPSVIQIPLYADGARWPDVSPFKVEVYEADGDVPRFDVPSRTLRIPAPKGLRATLRLSAALTNEQLALLGVWNWVPAAERTPALARRARGGAVWSLTPWCELEIVHAVQRPLVKPVVQKFLLERPRGATWVRPAATVDLDRMTTQHIDLMARWNEPVDGGVIGTPSNRAMNTAAFQVKITDPQGYGGIVEHTLPDPARPHRIAFGNAPTGTVGVATEARPKVHDFGDTRYRRVEYRVAATTRFSEYMPASVEAVPPGGIPERDHLTVSSDVERAWVLSSAPPPAPEVLYVVPTFGWSRSTSANGGQTSWRRGRGLRVWLGRPWNASGYGEMLAVVLPPVNQPIEPNDPPYKDVVTQWGSDPVWKAPYVNGVAPQLNQFPRARVAPDPTGAWLPAGTPAVEAEQPSHPFRVNSIPHAGLPVGWGTGLVDVAPHDVAWDAERGLWYCDIEINAGEAYCPFVRLALARYQPSSVDGAHLSTVVLSDFAALTPDRWVAVRRTSPTRRGVTLHGHRPVESSGHAEAWARRTQSIGPNGNIITHVPTGISRSTSVDVWVEQFTPSRGEDFGWSRVVDGEAAMRPVSARPVDGAQPLSSDDSVIVHNRRGEVRARELMARRDFEAVVAEQLVDATMAWPVMWDGTVTLPQAPSSTKRYRLVVAEYEEYLADDEEPYDSTLTTRRRRLVYVEHVELA